MANDGRAGEIFEGGFGHENRTLRVVECRSQRQGQEAFNLLIEEPRPYSQPMYEGESWIAEVGFICLPQSTVIALRDHLNSLDLES